MTQVRLDATDAMELAEILLFVRNWLARDTHVLAPSLAHFVGIEDIDGVTGYDLAQLRADLTRFAFLLGGDHEQSFLSGDTRGLPDR